VAFGSISFFIRRTQACGLSHSPEWEKGMAAAINFPAPPTDNTALTSDLCNQADHGNPIQQIEKTEAACPFRHNSSKSNKNIRLK
jgi:hypothetical protein